MSLHIIKQGISDTFHDEGRYGYQHLGINPGGAMDLAALRVVNCLAGNQRNEAVLEMHFPAPEMLFEQDVLIALSGADFTATINSKRLPLNCPVVVRQGSLLQFPRPARGARLYLAVQGGFLLQKWLGSYSTNLLVKAGGLQGSTVQPGDRIGFRTHLSYDHLLRGQQFVSLPYMANVAALYSTHATRFLPGPQYDLLMPESKDQLTKEPFSITKDSNRMGYRLQSKDLRLQKTCSLISSGVTRGTMQLLPDGQLIILMADHQTTGGYPVVGHVIGADLSTLAQSEPGHTIRFQPTDMQTAQQLLYEQHLHLLQLQNACNFRLKELTK